MASDPQKLMQVGKAEKGEAHRKERHLGHSDLLVWTLQQISLILKRLDESKNELTSFTDHLEVFKLLILDALDLTPQENPRG